MLLASRTEDPRPVLFADDAGERSPDSLADDHHGFYWTEGLRGLGWCRDGVPTLKGGSTIGIPSPPAIWRRQAEPGEKFVTPGIATAGVCRVSRRVDGTGSDWSPWWGPAGRWWGTPVRSGCRLGSDGDSSNRVHGTPRLDNR